MTINHKNHSCLPVSVRPKRESSLLLITRLHRRYTVPSALSALPCYPS